MHILIVKLSSIGDVVHALPAVALLRRALPEARISWAVERRASQILENSPAIDDLIVIDSRRWRKHPFSKMTMLELKQFRSALAGVDVAIDLQGLIKSGVVALASGAKIRAGFESSELRERASRLFLTDQIPTGSSEHVIEKNLSLVRWLLSRQQQTQNAEPEGRYEFPIHVSREDERYIEEELGGQIDRFAIINPGGGWPTKLWPAKSYGAITDVLWEEFGLRSLVTFGPGEEELAAAVAGNSTSGARPFASSLKQFVALARRARLFVGGDTGPLHIAAACGTPVVGLYGPTMPERNGPFIAQDVSVGRDLWCRVDCHKRSCWHWECMEIPIESVRNAIRNRVEIAVTPN